jgi:septum formation protein
MTKFKIILASQSPRRSQLLSLAEIPFEVMKPGIEESYPAEMEIEEIPCHIALNKALQIAKQIKNMPAGDRDIPVLSADTIVVLDKKILGKPANEKEAKEMLAELSGKCHIVITGVCILYKGTKTLFSEKTTIEFYPLSQASIDYYVKTFQPFDKAGAYAIQEWIGVTGIKSVQGDYYNVMGLPVSRVIAELTSLGVRPFII